MARRRDPGSYVFSQRVQRAFAGRLKATRKTKRQDQKLLSAALDLSRTSVSNIERGMHRIFLDQVFVAARALQVDVNDLIPTMAEVFKNDLVHTSSDSRLSPQEIEKAAELAKTVQQSKLSTKRSKLERPRRTN